MSVNCRISLQFSVIVGADVNLEYVIVRHTSSRGAGPLLWRSCEWSSVTTAFLKSVQVTRRLSHSQLHWWCARFALTWVGTWAAGSWHSGTHGHLPECLGILAWGRAHNLATPFWNLSRARWWLDVCFRLSCELNSRSPYRYLLGVGDIPPGPGMWWGCTRHWAGCRPTIDTTHGPSS